MYHVKFGVYLKHVFFAMGHMGHTRKENKHQVTKGHKHHGQKRFLIVQKKPRL